MSFFERYLTVWVALCIGGGILVGKVAPEIAQTLDGIAIYVNDAPVVSITASDASAAEEGQDEATFVVTRSVNLTGSVAVTVSFAGTADASDYTVTVATGGTWNASNGLLTLTDGVDTALFTVTPVDDAVVEDDETVVLTLTDPVDGNLVGFVDVHVFIFSKIAMSLSLPPAGGRQST